MKRITLLLQLLFVSLGALLPSFAFAHAGVGETGGFMHGLVHPFSGLDHVCAMLAVGDCGRCRWADVQCGPCHSPSSV
jgi:hydrogenase/urease accessory protein HupE